MSAANDRLTDREIADLCRRFANTLDAGEYGLATWHSAVARVGRELHTALGDALGHAPSPVVEPPAVPPNRGAEKQ